QMGFFISDLVLGKSLTLVSYLPVRNAPQTIQKIVEIIRQKNPDIELKTEGKAQSIEFGAGLKTFFVQKNQLLYIINQINSNAQPVIDAILRGDSSLVKSSRFKDVAEKLDIYKDIFLYVDFLSLLSKNKEYFGGEKVKLLSGWNINAYESLGIAFNCTTKDFVSQYVLTVNDKYQHWLKLFKSSSFNKEFLIKQSDFPGFALSVAINPTRLYMNVKEFLSAQDYQTFLQMKSMIKNQFNIELEELVNLFDGNFHYIIPAKITLEEAVKSSVMAFGIHDERDTMTMLDRIIDKSMSPMQKKMLIQKGNTYILPDMQIGFKDNNLIITYNTTVLKKVMSSTSSGSFMTKLQDQELKKMLKADTTVIFLSGALFRNKLDKISSLRENDLEGYGNLIKALLPKLSYLLYSFGLDDDALVGRFIIKTQLEKPFFQEVLPELVKIIKRLAQTNEVNSGVSDSEKNEIEDTEATDSIETTKIIDTMGDMPEWIKTDISVQELEGSKQIIFKSKGESKFKDSAKECASLNVTTGAAAATQFLFKEQIKEAFLSLKNENELKDKILKRIDSKTGEVKKTLNLLVFKEMGAWWRQLLKANIENNRLAGWSAPFFEYYIHLAMEYSVYVKMRDNLLKDIKPTLKLSKIQLKFYQNLLIKLQQLDKKTNYNLGETNKEVEKKLVYKAKKQIDKRETGEFNQKIIGKWTCVSMGEVLPGFGIDIPAALTFTRDGRYSWTYIRGGEKIIDSGKYFLI
ncbi:MAG: hypothetical protein CVV50_02740, partial [Spirochaetae bacterium HGW-Spirochaetae-6]